MAVEVPAYAQDVLAVVQLIPPGCVMSYGDVAEYIGSGGPRQVGQVMSRYGGEVPWWRVVRADGTPAPCHNHEAHELLKREGTPLRRDGAHVDMTRARWDGRAVTVG